MNASWIGRFALFALAVSVAAPAQAPAGAPAGTTGVCNDGSYSNAPSKRGACAGHKGVKTWYAATAASVPAPAASPAPAPAATPSPAPAPKASSTARTPAAGGGNGQVWLNTSTNVYHCQGDKSYGTTKAGQYMSEADAKTKGARPAYGKTCSH